MIEIEPVVGSGERRTRRGRIAVITGAVSLATASLGFVAGRAAAPDPAPRAASPVTTTAAERADDGAATLDTTGAAAPAATDPAAGGAAGDMATSGEAMGGQGMYSEGAYEEPQQELLSERTTTDGVVLRVHGVGYDVPEVAPGGDGWQPAAWCQPSGSLRISVAAPDSVNVAWAPWYTEPKDGIAVSTFASGYPEGSPRFGIVAQVPAGTTAVTFTTASGLSDTAAPVNGFVLALVPGPIEGDFAVTVDGPDGAVVHDRAQLTESWTSVEYRDACQPPPPALPPAGEQPADPAAAESAIHEAWRLAHDGDADAAARAAHVDDATGLAEAWAALDAGEYGEAARTSTATFRELVFTSPSEAWFRYDVETSIVDFPARYGIARLGDDGVWRITRQTICQDIALAPGFGCSPPVDTLYPPSAAGDPRYSPVPFEETAATLGE